jgi:hypothetical protein
MSASNWAVCPRCLHLASQAEAGRVASLQSKLTAEEFASISDSLAAAIDPEKFRTLREDYEFYGAGEGTVRWSYGASCDVCGLSVSLAGDKKFWEPGQ